jgi:hypothetical protein
MARFLLDKRASGPNGLTPLRFCIERSRRKISANFKIAMIACSFLPAASLFSTEADFILPVEYSKEGVGKRGRRGEISSKWHRVINLNIYTFLFFYGKSFKVY